MLAALKDIARHSLVYGLAIVFTKAIGFFMIPVYTRFLSPEDYGVLEMLDLFTSVFGLLVYIAIRSAVTRIYYEYEDGRNRREVISTALLSTVLFSVVAVALAWGVTDWISLLVFRDRQYGGYVRLVLLSFLLQTIGDLGFAYLQIRKRSGRFAILSVLKVFVQLSLNIVALVVLGMGVRGLLLAGIVSASLVAGYFFVTVTRETGFAWSRLKLRQLLAFGLPLVPANFATFIVNYFDRYFLNLYGSLASVGIYSLSYKFGMLIQLMITGPFISIWIPKRLEILREKDARETYAVVATYSTLVTCFAALVLSVFSREIIEIMAAPSYLEAYRYIPTIAFSYVMAGLVYQFNIGMHVTKKTRIISTLNVTSAALNVGLNLVLIPRIGIWGAALSTLVAFSIRTVLYYLWNQRIYPVPFENVRLLKIFVVGVAVYLLSTRLDSGGLALRVFSKSGLLLLFGVGLMALRFFSSREVQTVKSQLRRLRSRRRGREGRETGR